MLIDHFPLVGLRLTTPRLELRLPSPEELAALADLAADGIHDPEASPFIVPWTVGTAEEVARSVVQYYWRELGAWTPRLAVGLRKLGYRPDSHRRHALRGRMTVEHRLRLTRAAWERHRTIPVTVEGLLPCLPLLGLSAAGRDRSPTSS